MVDTNVSALLMYVANINILVGPTVCRRCLSRKNNHKRMRRVIRVERGELTNQNSSTQGKRKVTTLLLFRPELTDEERREGGKPRVLQRERVKATQDTYDIHHKALVVERLCGAEDADTFSAGS